jgi:hypothetical protein
MPDMADMNRFLVVILLAATSLFAKDHAPLPTSLRSAKTVYLLDASNDSAMFDNLYARLKKWGRWQVVADRKDADLVIALSDQNISYGSISTATAAAAPGYARATAMSVPVLSFPRILTIFDRSTGEQLFRISCERRLRASYTAGVLVNRTRKRIKISE